MTLQEHCKKDKLTLIALYALLRDHAKDLLLAGNMSELCQQSGVNRTQLYERKTQLWEAFGKIDLPAPGRPRKVGSTEALPVDLVLREQILRYRLEHPGATVSQASGHTRYSDGFRRLILDLADIWEVEMELFCLSVEVPYPTLLEWRKRDRTAPYSAHTARIVPALSGSATSECRCIVEDYSIWEGSLRSFLSWEAKRLRLAPNAIRRVLIITGMLPLKPNKAPRYRGSTVRLQPGSILVTDGKEIEVVSTASGEITHYNWQGIVDQATACHTAAVITDNECASGVRQAFEQSCQFLGNAPQVLLHDNKPIHQEAELKEVIEPTTKMVPATPGRPENKAVIEGEFGKYEQAVGTLYLDDSTPETLKRSAANEVVRAYVAGINHAGRAEFNGKSRQQVLRTACPDPRKDQEFIEQLQADHIQGRRQSPLPTQTLARAILDAGFTQFNLDDKDREGKIRTWISARYTPVAIRQGLALFGCEWGKGRLKEETAHRYLVKLIQSSQEEIDLRAHEDWLRQFAEIERSSWLRELEQDCRGLEADCRNDTKLEDDLPFKLSENAVFGGLPLARAFWEGKLKKMLATQVHRIKAVCRHIRRLYEAQWNDRFQLISLLVAWEKQLAP